MDEKLRLKNKRRNPCSSHSIPCGIIKPTEKRRNNSIKTKNGVQSHTVFYRNYSLFIIHYSLFIINK
jgi:hypothetical protein